MATDTSALIAALRKTASGIQDIINILADEGAAEKTQQQRAIALAKEFNRPQGEGLTRGEALQACKRHGFTPQTVGAWARGDYIKIGDDDLRYLGETGKGWLKRKDPEVVIR